MGVLEAKGGVGAGRAARGLRVPASLPPSDQGAALCRGCSAPASWKRFPESRPRPSRFPALRPQAGGLCVSAPGPRGIQGAPGGSSTSCPLAGLRAVTRYPQSRAQRGPSRSRTRPIVRAPAGHWRPLCGVLSPPERGGDSFFSVRGSLQSPPAAQDLTRVPGDQMRPRAVVPGWAPPCGPRLNQQQVRPWRPARPHAQGTALCGRGRIWLLSRAPATGVSARQRGSWHGSPPDAARAAWRPAGAHAHVWVGTGAGAAWAERGRGAGAITRQVTDLINFVPGGFFFLFPKNQRKQNIFLIK